MDDNKTLDRNANRDPITGAPGSHPVGTGVGAAAGAAMVGAATGTLAGPVGTVIGAAVGAVVGGLAGKAVAERIDPTVEDGYWRENYTSRPYVEPGSSYDDYGPAHGYGVSEYARLPGRTFDEAESGWRAAGRRAAAVLPSNGNVPRAPRETRGNVSATRSSAPCPATRIATANRPPPQLPRAVPASCGAGAASHPRHTPVHGLRRRKHNAHDGRMSTHGYGIEARHRASERAHANKPARFLILIVDATGVTAARLFDVDRKPVADFDGGSQEVAVMTQGLAPAQDAGAPAWDGALGGHSAEARRAADVYTLDV